MNGEGKRVLRLTLKKQAFDVMATREKTVELRLNMGPSDLYYEQQLLQHLANQEACRDTDEEESED